MGNRMYVEQSCGGWAVYWPGKPLGERLQGWYRKGEEADRAELACNRWLAEQDKKALAQAGG